MTDDKSDWEKVEAIYEATREKVKYQNGPLKGRSERTARWHGRLRGADVAVHRAVPSQRHSGPHRVGARSLLSGVLPGRWRRQRLLVSRARQPAVGRSAGIPEHRPILQKGDNFRDPDRPKDNLRYVSEYSQRAPRPKAPATRRWSLCASGNRVLRSAGHGGSAPLRQTAECSGRSWPKSPLLLQNRGQDRSEDAAIARGASTDACAAELSLGKHPPPHNQPRTAPA